MNTYTIAAQVLPSTTKKALILQSLLLACAVFLPALCHWAGFNARALLPMHWPILICGLVYGYRAGAFLAVASLALSYTLSGMPPFPMILVMSGEMLAYGFITGLLRQEFKLNYLMSLICALAAGRIVYLILAYFILGKFAPLTLTDGAFAVLAQLILIPFIAGKWIKNLQ
jgi:niacin transporter